MAKRSRSLYVYNLNEENIEQFKNYMMEMVSDDDAPISFIEDERTGSVFVSICTDDEELTEHSLEYIKAFHRAIKMAALKFPELVLVVVNEIENRLKDVFMHHEDQCVNLKKLYKYEIVSGEIADEDFPDIDFDNFAFIPPTEDWAVDVFYNHTGYEYGFNVAEKYKGRYE